MPAFAQTPRLLFGVKIGVPANGAIRGHYAVGTESSGNTAKAVIGASAELALPRNFALEVEGLFRPLAYSQANDVSYTPVVIQLFPGPVTPIKSQWSWNIKGHAWEFPVSIKKYFMTHQRVRAFAGGGFVVRYTTAATTSTYQLSEITFASPPDKTTVMRAGFVLGAGFDIPFLRTRLVPEFRYTPWLNAERINEGDGLNIGSTRHNLDILIGIKFRK
jgi:hypothetical protein